MDSERLQREQEEYEEWLLAEAEAAQLRAQEELAALVAREEVSCVRVCVSLERPYLLRSHYMIFT